MEEQKIEEAQAISLEEAKKVLEQHEQEMTNNFVKEYEALCQKYGRKLMPNIIISKL
jgi:hypothetical protein